MQTVSPDKTQVHAVRLVSMDASARRLLPSPYPVCCATSLYCPDSDMTNHEASGKLAGALWAAVGRGRVMVPLALDGPPMKTGPWRVVGRFARVNDGRSTSSGRCLQRLWCRDEVWGGCLWRGAGRRGPGPLMCYVRETPAVTREPPCGRMLGLG